MTSDTLTRAKENNFHTPFFSAVSPFAFPNVFYAATPIADVISLSVYKCKTSSTLIAISITYQPIYLSPYKRPSFSPSLKSSSNQETWATHHRPRATHHLHKATHLNPTHHQHMWHPLRPVILWKMVMGTPSSSLLFKPRIGVMGAWKDGMSCWFFSLILAYHDQAFLMGRLKGLTKEFWYAWLLKF